MANFRPRQHACTRYCAIDCTTAWLVRAGLVGVAENGSADAPGTEPRAVFDVFAQFKESRRLVDVRRLIVLHKLLHKSLHTRLRELTHIYKYQ